MADSLTPAVTPPEATMSAEATVSTEATVSPGAAPAPQPAPAAEAEPVPVPPGTVLPEWLEERAENGPVAQHRALPAMPALRIRMAWDRLRAQATEGDEVWSFVNPKNTWKRHGKRSGYAIVRDSEIRASVVVLRERG